MAREFTIQEANSILKNKDNLILKLGCSGRFLVPPKSIISYKFLAQVLRGEKQLLRLQEVKLSICPPRVKGLSVRELWPELSQNPHFRSFFPDMNENRFPPRRFFFQILAALFPEELENRLNFVKERKKQQEKEKKVVVLSEEMLQIIQNTEDLFPYIEGRKPGGYLGTNTG